MTTTARVADITHTHRYNEDRTPLDIVRLSWNGMAYYWQTEPDQYAVGQDVPINPPISTGGPITPAAGSEGITYAGAVNQEATR